MARDKRAETTSNVTTAGMSATEDRAFRQKRYAITQAARLSCFLLAVLLPVPLWAKLILIVGAFVLPWMGVMAANAPTIERARASSIVAREEVPLRIAIEPGRTIDGE